CWPPVARWRWRGPVDPQEHRGDRCYRVAVRWWWRDVGAAREHSPPLTDGTTTPLTVHGIARGVLSYLGAADDAIHDLPVHAQLRGDLRHWHAVSACGLHGGVPVPCSGCERFLGHVYGFLRGLQVGHCACAILSCWTVASRSAIRSSTVGGATSTGQPSGTSAPTSTPVTPEIAMASDSRRGRLPDSTAHTVA